MSLHRELARVATRSGMASLRDLEPRDIAVIVSYWHGGAADFFTMNVDIAKLGTPDNARSRFEASLRTGDPNHRIKAYFDTSATQRPIHQTSVRNQGVDRMLDKYVPVSETRRVESSTLRARPATITCAMCDARTSRACLPAPPRSRDNRAA